MENGSKIKVSQFPRMDDSLIENGPLFEDISFMTIKSKEDANQYSPEVVQQKKLLDDL